MAITIDDLQGQWVEQHGDSNKISTLDIKGDYFRKIISINGVLSNDCDNGRLEIKNFGEDIAHIYLHPDEPSETIVLTNVTLLDDILTLVDTDDLPLKVIPMHKLVITHQALAY